MIESTFVWSHDRRKIIDVHNRIIEIRTVDDRIVVVCGAITLFEGTDAHCKAYLRELGARLRAFKRELVEQAAPESAQADQGA